MHVYISLFESELDIDIILTNYIFDAIDTRIHTLCHLYPLLHSISIFVNKLTNIFSHSMNSNEIRAKIISLSVTDLN